MAFNPHGEDLGVPTPADASRILDEIAPVSRRSRRLARDVAFARPLLTWGLAWIAGAILYQYIPGVTGVILACAACASAAAVTWLVRPRDVRLHTERRFALCWLVLFATSPLLIAVAAPPNAHVMTVLLASLWAVGMLLYGVGVHDPTRLRIAAALHALPAAAAMSFTILRKALMLTDGNLGMHMRVLMDAGFVTTEEHWRGKRRTTLYRSTSAGRAAFDAHVRAP